MRRPLAALYAGAALCLALFAGATPGADGTRAQEALPVADVHPGPVSATAGGARFTLDISPKPVRPMRELTFVVTTTGAAGDGPAWIDLAMPGMRMPPNRVRLAKGSDGAFRGTGTIVRCMSGRKRWTAAVTLPGSAPVTFAFDVAD